MTRQFAAFALVVVVAAPTARAEEAFEGARSLAMGGALRAAAVSNPSLYLNPAALAVGRLYHVEAAYQYEAGAQGHLANASVVDSTNAVAGGIGATYSVSDPDHADRTAYDLRLGLGVPIGRAFSLGATLKYLHLIQDGVPRTGSPVAAEEGEPLLDDLTFDAGALLRVASFLSFGVTGYNLTALDSPEAPMKVGFGAAVNVAELAVIDSDVILDLSTYGKVAARYGIGGEYFAANRYPLRVGYTIDPWLDQQFLSGGLGYVDQRFAAEVSVRQGIAGSSSTTVTAALRFFVH
ncbi:MAG: hypothetical protein HYY06_29810 [Deltaproteobacteria bacterium]|nr:hypothetical protein [Deltaproteobacteria bacterium]